MTKPNVLFLLAALLLGLPAGASAQAPAARDQVIAAERAFARTMADRDHAAFATFVAEDAVFFGNDVLRGREKIAEGWRPLYTAPAAPFSWEPETVEVVGGTLALSSGPVRDPAGNRVGTFNSVWRLDPDGKWRVVFDRGCPPCACR